VRVGQHIPISPAAVPRFLAHFENAYGRLGRTEKILSAAAAHHRLLWIHPFVGGNGRVARLVSHATLLETLDTGGNLTVSVTLNGLNGPRPRSWRLNVWNDLNPFSD
jgi:Fic family protein